jgi:hypothetical protein
MEQAVAIAVGLIGSFSIGLYVWWRSTQWGEEPYDYMNEYVDILATLQKRRARRRFYWTGQLHDTHDDEVPTSIK